MDPLSSFEGKKDFEMNFLLVGIHTAIIFAQIKQLIMLVAYHITVDMKTTNSRENALMGCNACLVLRFSSPG